VTEPGRLDLGGLLDHRSSLPSGRSVGRATAKALQPIRVSASK